MARKPVRKPAKPADGSVGDLNLLRELSNAVAVSGDEGAVRRIVLDAIRDHVDEARVDALGNVLAVKKAAGARRGERVLVAAHMDEVGFMIVDHDADGTLRFELVGRIDERDLLGKAVLIGPKRLAGVIGAMAVHLLPADRRNTVVKVSQMRIDLGADSKEAARQMVSIGERGTLAGEFEVWGDFSLRGRALDDRLGCATLIGLLRGRTRFAFDLHAAFTVQEEAGVRGARVAAYAVDPACAFVLDCSPARDLPDSRGRENTQYNTRLGRGPAIYVADQGMISDERLVQYLRATAESAGLPYQVRQPGGGGTDAGAIHRARKGVPSVSVSVPGRYLHTAAALVRLEDWHHTIRLVRLALENWTPKVLKR